MFWHSFHNIILTPIFFMIFQNLKKTTSYYMWFTNFQLNKRCSQSSIVWQNSHSAVKNFLSTSTINLTSENSHVNVMKLLKIALFTHLIQHVITLLVLHMREFISIAIIIWTFSKKGPNSISKVALKWNPSDGKRQRGRSKETWREELWPPS